MGQVKSANGQPALGPFKNGTNLRKTTVYNNYYYVHSVGNEVNLLEHVN